MEKKPAGVSGGLGGLAAIQAELVRSLLELTVGIPGADFVGGSFLALGDHPVVVAVVPTPTDGNDFEAEGFGKVGAEAFWRGDGLHWFVWLTAQTYRAG